MTLGLTRYAIGQANTNEMAHDSTEAVSVELRVDRKSRQETTVISDSIPDRFVYVGAGP